MILRIDKYPYLVEFSNRKCLVIYKLLTLKNRDVGHHKANYYMHYGSTKNREKGTEKLFQEIMAETSQI